MLQSFVADLKKDKRRSIYPTLEKAGIKLNPNFQIELFLEHSTSLDIYHSIAAEMTGYFKKELNNFTLVISPTINEKKMSKPNKPYTNQEKYQALVDKNPALDALRKTLKLDIN